MITTFARRPVALATAAGVLGVGAWAAVAVTSHRSAAAQAAPPVQPAAASSVMPAMPGPAATSSVPGAGRAGVTLGVPQVSAIAARAAGGQVEQIESGPTTAAPSYVVSVTRANGTETQLVIDARTGRVLSTAVEPQDSATAADPQGSPDPQDALDAQDYPASPDPQESPGPQDAADASDTPQVDH
jgi:hypothetical protein